METDRLHQLKAWLQNEFPNQHFDLSIASADASFRRYFRVQFEDRSLIAMDAPPQHEDCRPFIKIAQLFSTADVNVPSILSQNLTDGFLLLTDLGNTTYLQQLVAHPSEARAMYSDAIDALIRMQQISQENILLNYDRALLQKELNLFPEWYLTRHKQFNLSQHQSDHLQSTFSAILANNLEQPKVFVHRDFHSRNLMITTPNPGILDFQDAVYGPITYDLVSLFKDAYIQWEEELVLDWVIRYWEKARKARLPVSSDFSIFYRDFEWMGVQRHLKVLGIFARLYHRDNKAGYLNDIPLVLHYLRKTCERYRELHLLKTLLDEIEDAPSPQQVGYTF